MVNPESLLDEFSDDHENIKRLVALSDDPAYSATVLCSGFVAYDEAYSWPFLNSFETHKPYLTDALVPWFEYLQTAITLSLDVKSALQNPSENNFKKASSLLIELETHLKTGIQKKHLWYEILWERGICTLFGFLPGGMLTSSRLPTDRPLFRMVEFQKAALEFLLWLAQYVDRNAWWNIQTIKHDAFDDFPEKERPDVKKWAAEDKLCCVQDHCRKYYSSIIKNMDFNDRLLASGEDYDRPYLKSKEAAKRLGVTPARITQLCKEGILRSTQQDGRIVGVNPDDVKREAERRGIRREKRELDEQAARIEEREFSQMEREQ